MRWAGLLTFAPIFKTPMPQDANARLNAKRKATKKIAIQKAKAAAAGEQGAPKKEKKNAE